MYYLRRLTAAHNALICPFCCLCVSERVRVCGTLLHAKTRESVDKNHKPKLFQRQLLNLNRKQLLNSLLTWCIARDLKRIRLCCVQFGGTCSCFLLALFVLIVLLCAVGREGKYKRANEIDRTPAPIQYKTNSFVCGDESIGLSVKSCSG